jgi:hypothetical protein
MPRLRSILTWAVSTECLAMSVHPPRELWLWPDSGLMDIHGIKHLRQRSLDAGPNILATVKLGTLIDDADKVHSSPEHDPINIRSRAELGINNRRKPVNQAVNVLFERGFDVGGRGHRTAREAQGLGFGWEGLLQPATSA